MRSQKARWLHSLLTSKALIQASTRLVGFSCISTIKFYSAKMTSATVNQFPYYSFRKSLYTIKASKPSVIILKSEHWRQMHQFLCDSMILLVWAHPVVIRAFRSLWTCLAPSHCSLLLFPFIPEPMSSDPSELSVSFRLSNLLKPALSDRFYIGRSKISHHLASS